MKIIDVPKPIVLKVVHPDGRDGTEEFAFRKFVTIHLDAYSTEWAKNWAQVKQLDEIVKIVEKEGDTIVFEREDDYEVYKAAVEIPRFKGSVGRQFIPFADAARKVQEVKK